MLGLQIQDVYSFGTMYLKCIWYASFTTISNGSIRSAWSLMHRFLYLPLVFLFSSHPQNSLGSGTKPPSVSVSDSREHIIDLDICVSGHSEVVMIHYTSLLRKLYNINLLNPVKMGLDNANKLYKLFGDPVSNIPIVHVAGTNGKGSVALKIAQSLQLGGVRTGLFVSPHISSFRERIQVNGQSMSEETVVVRQHSSRSLQE